MFAWEVAIFRDNNREIGHLRGECNREIDLLRAKVHRELPKRTLKRVQTASKTAFLHDFDVFLRAYSRLLAHRITGAPSKLRLGGVARTSTDGLCIRARLQPHRKRREIGRAFRL